MRGRDLRLGFVIANAIVWDVVAVASAWFPSGNPSWLRMLVVAGAIFYTGALVREWKDYGRDA